jgi:Glycosyl hydrolase 36 superfamily, catalytic domain
VRALLLIVCVGCGEDGPITDCLDPLQSWDAPGDELTTFRRVEGGAGDFGDWVVGPGGLPEYAYTLDQANDPRADWPNSEDRRRRDHWHLVGNRRLNATVYNEGYVEVYAQDRGAELLDRADDQHRGGGYSIIDDGGLWNSAWSRRPPEAQTARNFGMGYARFTTCRATLAVTHTISAPAGDHPFVVDEVTLSNRGAPRTLTHYEVWEVNRHYLLQQLLRSGTLNPGLPDAADEERNLLNARYTISAAGDDVHARIRHRAEGAASDEPADENLTPPDIFLADLDGTDSTFYTRGRPPDLGQLDPENALGEPGTLVAARRVSLGAGATVKLRYAFGWTAQDAPLPDFSVEDEARPLVYVDDERLKREAAWHAYYLANSGGWNDYFQHFTVNQGGAYWYLHGLDGAVRDFVFTATALTYIDPALAREVLLGAARMRFEDSGALAYSIGGFGQLSTALIHEHPSDLELFLWWGLAEYVFATGDVSILDAAEPFWPRSRSQPRPIRAHIAAGWRYLRDVIGLGPHGLIRLGDGDWDDSITFYASDRGQAAMVGESVANTAMAAVVAPMAALLADPATAAELSVFAVQQKSALAQQWTGDWYRRAWFGPDEPFGNDQLFLLPNAFALVAEDDGARAATLLSQIKEHLEDPSTTSMVQFWNRVPPAKTMPGITDEGGSNPALTALAAWGASLHDPDAAWRQLQNTTMARKADVYPRWWFGIWSGPDSQYTSVNPQLAGQSWASLATPMTDYPIMNSNAHAGVLLALFRAAGIAPTVSGGRGCLRIAPARDLKLDTPLVRVEKSGARLHVEYRPVADGKVCLLLRDEAIVLDVRRGQAVTLDR